MLIPRSKLSRGAARLVVTVRGILAGWFKGCEFRFKAFAIALPFRPVHVRFDFPADRQGTYSDLTSISELVQAILAAT